MSKTPVSSILISDGAAGQRIDNYLITHLKGVPKSHIYRIIRKGEVRINKKRIKQLYRLQAGDVLRLPPLEVNDPSTATPGAGLLAFLATRILYEDQHFFILNKPSGLPVHGGGSVKWGLIEALRFIYPEYDQLELVHRLDRGTSGCLIVAKKRSVLRELHGLLRVGQVKKMYHVLTKGHWKPHALRVEAALQKKAAPQGECRVYVHEQGKPSVTVFTPLRRYRYATLMQALLETGRTHQIRVHAQYRGHQVAGDEKYGDQEFNSQMHEKGLNRLFLHAYSLEFVLPSTGQKLQITAPLDADLQACLKALE